MTMQNQTQYAAFVTKKMPIHEASPFGGAEMADREAPPRRVYSLAQAVSGTPPPAGTASAREARGRGAGLASPRSTHHPAAEGLSLSWLHHEPPLVAATASAECPRENHRTPGHRRHRRGGGPPRGVSWWGRPTAALVWMRSPGSARPECLLVLSGVC